MQRRKPNNGVSRAWVVASVFAFTGVEIVLGGYIGPVIAGRFMSHVGVIRLEVMLMLASYMAGGFAIGLLSPSVRVIEAVTGAAISAILPFLMGVLSPVRFYVATPGRLMAAGALAGFLAFLGADAGERFAASLGNRESQEYAGPDERKG